MYEVNEVFKPKHPIGRISGPVRVLKVVPDKSIVLIRVDGELPTAPFQEQIDDWDKLIGSDLLERVPDPYSHLTSVPNGLPVGSSKRLASVNAAVAIVANADLDLSKPRQLAAEISKAADEICMSKLTTKRWIFEWLRSGRNPASIVRLFFEEEKRNLAGNQIKGKKRGPKSTKPQLASTSPAHVVAGRIDKAYATYIKKQRMTWRSAYFEMLIALFKVPPVDLSTREGEEVLLTPGLIEKYGLPSWYQFRNRCRKLLKKESEGGTELPRGKRGRATVPGPGYFEIDATHFQIQLLSVLTKSELVGRPSVYLIVDIFSGAITGYTVTLENPSWAVAAIALYNCFTDKQFTFDRLGLPFKSADWNCQHLPTVLRADRAELVSNMGQDFALSGIRVNVTPSMTPEAKGTVEGKNGEMKRPTFSRFNLPGLFKKYRKRREKDGKKAATLNLIEFERILVDIIMDLNRKPVRRSKLPNDAVFNGSLAASRIGLFEWGIKNRPGFTGRMGVNFAYEHLLTQGKGVVTPRGILFDGELFLCDRLRELGLLTAALAGHFPIRVSFNPLFSGEIFAFDSERKSYFSVPNEDLQLTRTCASFAEAREVRATKSALIEQAGLNHHGARRVRIAAVKSDIQDAHVEKAMLPELPAASKNQIRTARAADKARMRGAGMNGVLPSDSAESPVVPAAQPPANGPVGKSAVVGKQAGIPAISIQDLWSQVDVVSK